MNKPLVHIDLGANELINLALKRDEGTLTTSGALLTSTGKRCGRSPNDRFIVNEPTTSASIDWGDVNRPIAGSIFDSLWEKISNYLGLRETFVSHLHVGQDANYYIPVKLTTQTAWHSLFGYNMFIRPDIFNVNDRSVWEILHAADFVCDPRKDETNSEATVMINFAQRRVLIAGMKYAGELKKAMFSVQNYLLPLENVMPMHCAANVGDNGDTALFFGLSGTGKTTLSADPDRYLIGDDEHGWAPGSVFNLEGGCYAKTINLSAENEPIIWNAIKSGAIVENVSTEKGGMKPDFSDLSITENGRCSYPLDHVQKRCIANQAGEPKNVIFLTCDVSGVLPPVSVLSKEAAAFHFLSGYTAKVGSTELGAAAGINPTFSTCFGAPFMPRRAGIYAKLLMDRIEEFGSSVYLVNTGWTGGAGDNGKRFPIPVTRAIITAITQGQLQDCKMEHLDTLNLDIPLKIDGVDSSYLNPRSNWKSVDAYDHQAKKLAKLFVENIVDFNPSEDVLAAGPQI